MSTKNYQIVAQNEDEEDAVPAKSVPVLARPPCRRDCARRLGKPLKVALIAVLAFLLGRPIVRRHHHMKLRDSSRHHPTTSTTEDVLDYPWWSSTPASSSSKSQSRLSSSSDSSSSSSSSDSLDDHIRGLFRELRGFASRMVPSNDKSSNQGEGSSFQQDPELGSFIVWQKRKPKETGQP